MDLNKLREDHERYIAKMIELGKPITHYSCPVCDQVIATEAAPVGDVWDTLSICPGCGEHHMKITKGDHVQAKIPQLD